MDTTTGLIARARPTHPGITSTIPCPAVKKTCWKMALMERSSCNPVEKTLGSPAGRLSGPGIVPLTPSGKNGRARFPMVRAE